MYSSTTVFRGTNCSFAMNAPPWRYCGRNTAEEQIAHIPFFFAVKTLSPSLRMAFLEQFKPAVRRSSHTRNHEGNICLAVCRIDRDQLRYQYAKRPHATRYSFNPARYIPVCPRGSSDGRR